MVALSQHANHTVGDASTTVTISGRNSTLTQNRVHSKPNNAYYTGGGTYFRVTDDVLHLNQGSMVTFDAKLFHRGMPITSGVRYLLVGFCHTARYDRTRPSIIDSYEREGSEGDGGRGHQECDLSREMFGL